MIEALEFEAHFDLKKSSEEGEMIGISMIDHEVDPHGDMMLAQTVVGASESFMRDLNVSNTIGEGHVNKECPAYLTKSWVTDAGGNFDGIELQPGKMTWVVGIKTDDPAIREKVRSGQYTGFSIEGPGKGVSVSNPKDAAGYLRKDDAGEPIVPHGLKRIITEASPHSIHLVDRGANQKVFLYKKEITSMSTDKTLETTGENIEPAEAEESGTVELEKAKEPIKEEPASVLTQEDLAAQIELMKNESAKQIAAMQIELELKSAARTKELIINSLQKSDSLQRLDEVKSQLVDVLTALDIDITKKETPEAQPKTSPESVESVEMAKSDENAELRAQVAEMAELMKSMQERQNATAAPVSQSVVGSEAPAEPTVLAKSALTVDLSKVSDHALMCAIIKTQRNSH